MNNIVTNQVATWNKSAISLILVVLCVHAQKLSLEVKVLRY